MSQSSALFSLRNKLFFAFFLLTTFIVAAISATLFFHMRTNHLDTLRRDLKVIVGIAALRMQGVMSDAQRQKSEASHQELRNQLEQVKNQDPDIEKIIVLQLMSPSVTSFVIAEELGPQNTSAQVGKAYPLPSELNLDAILSGSVVTGSISGAAVETITAFAPIRNAQGVPIAILGIAVDAVRVSEDIRHFFTRILGIGIGATLIVTFLSWILARNFSRRLSRLDGALNHIASGQLDIALAVDGSDEVAALASRINQVATALFSERESMLLSAIESLVAALEAKDPYTYGHSSQVSSMAAAIARQMNLGEKDLFQVRIAALLHDIGKIGVPDQVLNKPGALDAGERKTIEQHPVIGAKILTGIPALSQVTEMVKHHHARWDGNGYPEPLAGEAIPLGARIINVADTFQAMTSDRTYRKGMSATVALTELKRCSGTQFDPDIVAVFEKTDYISSLCGKNA